MPEQTDIVRFVEAKSWYMIDWIKLDSNPKYSSKISAGFSVFEYEEKKNDDDRCKQMVYVRLEIRTVAKRRQIVCKWM